MQRSSHVTAIEVDPVLVHYVRHKFGEAIAAGQLTVIEGDVLQTDLAGLAQGVAPVIAGNLPYYITSPILEKVFALGNHWDRAVFLVQAEVAARISAQPGTRDFGYLSVLCQVQAETETLFTVPADAFRPPPKVESAVVRLTRRDMAAEWGISNVPAFLHFAQICFHQKRKTLRNNLAQAYGTEKIEGLPEGRMRAEQLSVKELAALFAKLAHG